MSFSIEHCAVRVRDLEASIKFYQDMFEAKVILKRNLAGGKKIVFLQIGPSMLELMHMGEGLAPVDAREHYGVHHIGIGIDDFESVYRKLKAKGVEFLGEPIQTTPGIRLAFLRDPNGAVIELACRDPKVFQDALKKGTVNW